MFDYTVYCISCERTETLCWCDGETHDEVLRHNGWSEDEAGLTYCWECTLVPYLKARAEA